MKLNFLVATLLLILMQAYSQEQSIKPTELVDKITVSTKEQVMDVTGLKADSAEMLISTAKDIKYWINKKSFSGQARFGFHGTNTRTGNDDLYNIYGGLNMAWDMYPGNLDFNTLFGITFTDGELQQNVSRIDASYDHIHANVANGLLLENYVYTNRSTDAYLGIDQRYEIGGGIIINNWIKRLISPADEKFPFKLEGSQQEDWNSLLADIQPGITEKDVRSISDQYKEAVNKNRKNNSKLRTALLIGLYFELETTTVLDSISLPVTTNFRWTLRPTMDVKLRDGWKLQIRPYFKMPMPWDWQSIVVAEDGSTSVKADYFVELTARLSTQLLSKRVEIGFIYTLVYDNAVARTYYKTGDGTFQLLQNNDLHQSYRLSLNVSLAGQN